MAVAGRVLPVGRALLLVGGLVLGVASAPLLARAATSDPSRPGAAGDATRTLPRQFTVEVGPGGTLVADGTRLGSVGELERWAQRAVQASRFSGAVIFGDPVRDGTVITQVTVVTSTRNECCSGTSATAIIDEFSGFSSVPRLSAATAQPARLRSGGADVTPPPYSRATRRDRRS